MILKENIYIESFKLHRTLHIYLPNDIQPDERFPVIYMFDGHNLFYDSDATYGKSWGIKDALDTHNQRIIVVGLECNHEGNMRLCEFSPYSFKDKFFGEVTGLGKTTIEWICETLKPYIDEKFPTKPEREYTAIGGSSMGGLMSVYGLAARSDIFSMGICVSPFYDHVFKKLVDDISKFKIHKKTKAYISWGRYEFHTKKQLAVGTEKNMIVTRIFSQKGVTVYPHMMVEGAHNEESWEKETFAWLYELGLYKKHR